MAITIALPEAFHVQTGDEGKNLRIAWDNRRVSKDNGLFVSYIAFWMIWAPVTFCVSFFLTPSVWLRNEAFDACGAAFLTGWNLFACAATLLIPLALIGRWRSEWIEVTPTYIAHGVHRVWALSPKTYALVPGMALALGRYWDENTVTLSLIWTPKDGFVERRAIFACWLAPQLRKQVFLAIGAYVEAYKLPLECKMADRHNGSWHSR